MAAPRVAEIQRIDEIVILSNRDIDGTTFYLLRLQLGGTGGEEERYLVKRFSDFQRLDSALRAEAVLGSEASSLPDLPDSGAVGNLVRSVDADAAAKRQEGLQAYLEAVAATVSNVVMQPALKVFLAENLVDAAVVVAGGNKVPDPEFAAPLRTIKRECVMGPVLGAVNAAGTATAENEGIDFTLEGARIMSYRDIKGTQWYLVHVYGGGHEWFCGRRFTDFVRLDEALHSGPGEVKLPKLPEKGTLGIRHMLDVGGFNEKRMEGLRNYLDVLFEQVSSTSDRPGLTDFFRGGLIDGQDVVAAKFQVPENWEPPK